MPKSIKQRSNLDTYLIPKEDTYLLLEDIQINNMMQPIDHDKYFVAIKLPEDDFSKIQSTYSCAGPQTTFADILSITSNQNFSAQYAAGDDITPITEIRSVNNSMDRFIIFKERPSLDNTHQFTISAKFTDGGSLQAQSVSINFEP